jgi:hypothetical protein
MASINEEVVTFLLEISRNPVYHPVFNRLVNFEPYP